METGTSVTEKDFLLLFCSALARLPFQFEVQTTYMISLNLIPCIDIYVKTSSNPWNKYLYTPLLSKRFLSFLNRNTQPCHVINAEYLKQYCQFWAATKCHSGNFSVPNKDNCFDTESLIYVFVHINLGVLRLPVPGGHFVYAVVYSSIIGCPNCHLSKRPH